MFCESSLWTMGCHEQFRKVKGCSGDTALLDLSSGHVRPAPASVHPEGDAVHVLSRLFERIWLSDKHHPGRKKTQLQSHSAVSTETESQQVPISAAPA